MKADRLIARLLSQLLKGQQSLRRDQVNDREHLVAIGNALVKMRAALERLKPAQPSDPAWQGIPATMDTDTGEETP